jgi:hypothetical protein
MQPSHAERLAITGLLSCHAAQLSPLVKLAWAAVGAIRCTGTHLYITQDTSNSNQLIFTSFNCFLPA